MKKISILIPVYNEISTLEEIVKRVEACEFCNLEKEIILIDDNSTDGTKDIYPKLPHKVIYHEINQGKGAALRDGIKAASGDIIIIQDADLEYNPKDYEPLVQMIFEGKAEVCYGSRFDDKSEIKKIMFLNLIGNKTLSFLTNILYGAKLTDMETCYKAFRAELIKNMVINSNGFDFEPEITAKILKKKVKFCELPISYNGRSFSEGKKISWLDGFQAIFTLIKYKFFD